VTTPCDGKCSCETACPSCPSAASSCLPPFAARLPFVAPLRADVEAWGAEWLAARVAQHKVRIRFPNAGPGHALPQSESVQPDPRREASEAGSTQDHNGTSKQAEGSR
jgi:hypothetical protein